MPQLKNLIGKTFGRITVLRLGPPYISPKGQSYARWICRCSCGTEWLVRNSHLLNSGHMVSCGCWKKEITSKLKKQHGLCHLAAYDSWIGARARCTNLSDKGYKWYGARGIHMCERWLNSFENFLADMGDRPPGKTLDRINNDGPYSSENCRWATRKQQNNNMRRPRSIVNPWSWEYHQEAIGA